MEALICWLDLHVTDVSANQFEVRHDVLRVLICRLVLVDAKEEPAILKLIDPVEAAFCLLSRLMLSISNEKKEVLV